MVVSLLGLASCTQGKPAGKYEVEHFTAHDGSTIDITLIKHGSLEIRYGELSIQVDPVEEYGRATDYAADFPKADYILVTHEHGDHFDPSAIQDLTDENTHLITNDRCAASLGYGTVMANGDGLDLPEGIHIDAIPAYNTTEGHLNYHPQGRDNGFVLTLGGLRIYIAGDTEDIPEMAELKDIDVAFLPVNQPYTMTPEQCINAARMFSPKVLIPYHYGNTDISAIPAAIPGIDVRIRQMQ